MDEREKLMLAKLRPERHASAMMALATIRFIKEECKKNIKCECCRFFDEKAKYWNPCCFCGEDDTPSDWDEYDLTERIYK